MISLGRVHATAILSVLEIPLPSQARCFSIKRQRVLRRWQIKRSSSRLLTFEIRSISIPDFGPQASRAALGDGDLLSCPLSYYY